MTDVTAFLARLVQWARAEPGLVAMALVGSHARGTARPDSDIDIVLVCDFPQDYLADRRWVKRFGTPVRLAVEEWGIVTSLRVWYAGGREVEYGLAPADWAADPMDEGDARVVADGIRVLFERDGFLSRRIRAFGQPPRR